MSTISTSDQVAVSYVVFKRAFDIIISIIGLLVLSPLLAAIIVVIKLDSRGPVIYRAQRVGRNGTSFRMLKFRTMVSDAEQMGGSSTPDDDPRITRIGRTLRRWKFDELPQLANVLGGQMSIVGPRPQVQWAVDTYSIEERRILLMKPGIVDLASLKFYNEGLILLGSDNPDLDYMKLIHPEKIKLSLEYLQNRSVRLDLEIIIKTMIQIFR